MNIPDRDLIFCYTLYIWQFHQVCLITALDPIGHRAADCFTPRLNPDYNLLWSDAVRPLWSDVVLIDCVD